MLGYQFAITGHNLDRNSAILKRGERGAGALLGRIEKTRETREHQFCFVADDGIGVIKWNFAPGDAQNPEPFFFEGVLLLVYPLQDSLIYRTLEFCTLFFIMSTKTHNVIRRRP